MGVEDARGIGGEGILPGFLLRNSRNIRILFPFFAVLFRRTNRTMADTTGADAAAKKVVMVTGGTGLVGCGIKEFVSTDAEVSALASSAYRHPSFECSANDGGRGRAAGKRFYKYLGI